VPIVTGGLGWLLVKNQERIYEASATLLVQQRRSGFSPGISDFNLSEQLAVTYGTLVASSPFLKQVIENTDVPLSLGTLKGMVRTETGDRPPTVTISVQHTDPELTYTTANVVAEEFIGYVVKQRLVEIANLQAAAAAQGLTNIQDLVAAQWSLIDSITLLEPASRPGSPILPRTRYNVTLAVLLGGVLGLVGTLLLGSMRDTVRNPDELRRRFGVTSLGTVFRWTSQDVEEDELVVWKAPASGYAESFRQIRTNIQFATAGQQCKVYLVTSPGPGEGKTTVLSNLAITMAQTGRRIVIVDCDLRRPAIHRRFAAKVREPGLSSFLADENMTVSDVLLSTQLEGVSVVPGGPIPPNPSELLSSPRMSTLLGQLTDLADLVLLDTPPVLMVADTPVVAAQVDGAIVVVDGLNTKSSSLRAALETLYNTQVNVLGVVLNKLKRVRFGYGYGYGYPYYYDSYYYQYTSSPDGEKATANGAVAFYKRPVNWLRSVLGRSTSSSDRS